MRIRCNECGKSISTEVPDETIIRAWIVCPECIEGKVKEQTNDYKYCGCNSNWKAYYTLSEKQQEDVFVTSEECPQCQYNYWTFKEKSTEMRWHQIVKKQLKGESNG